MRGRSRLVGAVLLITLAGACSSKGGLAIAKAPTTTTIATTTTATTVATDPSSTTAAGGGASTTKATTAATVTTTTSASTTTTSTEINPPRQTTTLRLDLPRGSTGQAIAFDSRNHLLGVLATSAGDANQTLYFGIDTSDDPPRVVVGPGAINGRATSLVVDTAGQRFFTAVTGQIVGFDEDGNELGRLDSGFDLVTGLAIDDRTHRLAAVGTTGRTTGVTVLDLSNDNMKAVGTVRVDSAAGPVAAGSGSGRFFVLTNAGQRCGMTVVEAAPPGRPAAAGSIDLGAGDGSGGIGYDPGTNRALVYCDLDGKLFAVDVSANNPAAEANPLPYGGNGAQDTARFAFDDKTGLAVVALSGAARLTTVKLGPPLDAGADVKYVEDRSTPHGGVLFVDVASDPDNSRTYVLLGDTGRLSDPPGVAFFKD